MPQTPHVEKHFTSGEMVRDTVPTRMYCCIEPTADAHAGHHH